MSKQRDRSDSKAVGHEEAGSFALSPIRAVFLDGSVPVVEPGSEEVRTNLHFRPPAGW